MGIVKQNLWKFRFIVLVLVVGSVEQDHYLVFIIKTVFVFIDLDYVCISEILNGYDNLSRECDCQVACRFEYFLAINFNYVDNYQTYDNVLKLGKSIFQLW